VSELSTVAKQIRQQARTLAVKAEAAGDRPSQHELEAIKRAINRLQGGLNRIQTETDELAPHGYVAANR
jgi:hypothetical protein